MLPGAPLHMHPDKSFDGTVVCPLDIIGKITRRKLACATVIGDAFAADTFAGTRLIRAIAAGFVGIGVACFHELPLAD